MIDNLIYKFFFKINRFNFIKNLNVSKKLQTVITVK
jgi:hypothetical protein